QLGEPVEAAFAPMSVTIHLADDVDLGRGDMLCRPNNQPAVGQDLDAMVCWMTDKPLQPRGRYALKHTTRWTRAMITELLYRLDVGCGNAYLLEVLRKNDAQVALTGLEYTPEMVEIGNSRGVAACPIVQGDVRELPFPGGAFDVAITERCIINVMDRAHQADSF